MSDDHTPPGDLPHPGRIGPYKVLQVLGEGGMGIVYEAEQTEPVARRVALKIIKLGMDTREIVARFEVERQALAVMDHPGIAKVLDAGGTETGRPFFVMELVKGIPLTEYCDIHQVSTAQRLELFIKLCHAIQHAHQKGVIHRDLKPANVLVALQDGEPQPKVIDFGVAKAIGYRLTDKTLVTQYGQAIGTPAYMSPEQAEMSGLDVDTRTDIYALGVMLYQLLVGRLPVDPESVGINGFIAQLVMRETDPPTPSARLQSLGDDQRTVADRRATDPASLRRQLRGDLDWIIVKAMDKDRTRRYATANGLALDIQRHLREEPVVARPPTAGYRFGKFVRRHTAAVAAAAVVVVSLVVGLALATVGLGRAHRAEQLAAAEAAASQQVSDFLVGLFQVSDPTEARANSVTAREILDEGAAQIDRELAGQPVTQSRLMNTMGGVYRGLGLFDDAATLLEEALRVRKNAYGEIHLAVAETSRDLGNLYRDMGRYDEARSLAERALAIREQLLGPDHEDVAASLRSVGIILRTLGEPTEAKAYYERALSILERRGEAADGRMAGTIANLAVVHRDQAEYDEAEALYRRALAIEVKIWGPDHYNVSLTVHNLADVLRVRRRPEEALPFAQRSLQIRERALDPEHPEVARALNMVAAIRLDMDQPTEAEPLLQRSLAIREKALGPDHPLVATTLLNLGSVYSDQGRYAEAEVAYGRALAIREEALGPKHPSLASVWNNLAIVRVRQGRYPEAERAYHTAITIGEEALGPDHPELAGTLVNLGRLHRRQHEYGEAEPFYQRALSIWERALGPDHPTVARTLNSIGVLYILAARLPEAEAPLQRALSIRENTYGPEHRLVAESMENLASLFTRQDRFAEAEPLYRRAVAIGEALLPDDRSVVRSLRSYADLLRKMGRGADADSVDARATALSDRA